MLCQLLRNKYTKQEANNWLNKSNDKFDGLTPRKLIYSGRIDEVIQGV